MNAPGGATPRAAMIAVVGSTNVGKSTLVNALVKEKVSIVSPIVQTTRTLVRAIWTEPRGQLVFLDTPGTHAARYELGRAMNRTARGAVEGVDIILLVLDVSRPPRLEDEGWLRKLCRPEQEATLLWACNKVDRHHTHEADYTACWARLHQGPAQPRNVTSHRVSGLTGAGIDGLRDALFAAAPTGPPLFPPDLLTDYPRKLALADIVREQYAPYLKDELPHALAVWIETIEETAKGWTINGIIYVSRHSQKGIVLGRQGRLLKKVVHAAEKEMATTYDQPVKLKLWVKAEKEWMRNFWMLKKLGYV